MQTLMTNSLREGKERTESSQTWRGPDSKLHSSQSIQLLPSHFHGSQHCENLSVMSNTDVFHKGPVQSLNNERLEYVFI